MRRVQEEESMLERLVSLVGLLALMGLAWAFSKHRHAIQWRTIAWGVGLQIVFALIILGEGAVSYSGMFLLTALLALYLCEPELQQRGLSRPLAGAAVAGAGAGLVLLTRAIGGATATAVTLVLAVIAVIVLGWRGYGKAGRWTASVALLSSVGFCWQRGIEGQALFQALSDRVAAFLSLSNAGASFLFGNLSNNEHFFNETGTWPGFGFQFAFTVLPTIIFFSAFMGVMYYLGIVQVIIRAMARFMHWSMQTSGSETVSVSGNIFVGQTESPLLVRPFLAGMTVSELHAVMVGGFATVAGGVLAGYIQMGVSAGHLIAASVMSAPAALVIAKLLYPETEKSQTAGEVEIPDVSTSDNVVGAAAQGTTDGLKLALNVGAMLLAFIALIAVADSILGWLDQLIDGRLLGWLNANVDIPGLRTAVLDPATGELRGYFPGSLRTFFGTLLAPLAWLMGVPWKDASAVGNLLGIKLSVNEFVAFGLLAQELETLDHRSGVIATYALCGFANFSSIGIQIGGIGVLAPERRSELSRIGVRAMFGGALASWMTATVAGILL